MEARKGGKMGGRGWTGVRDGRPAGVFSTYHLLFWNGIMTIARHCSPW